jgi:hypothetical protein
MASWAAVLALTGFKWDGVAGDMEFAAREGTFFWSNGDAWGTCRLVAEADQAVSGKKNAAAKSVYKAEIKVMQGKLALESFRVAGAGEARFPNIKILSAGDSLSMVLKYRAN